MKPNTPQTGLSPSALLRILRRRKFYVLLPVLLLTPAAAYYASKLPQKFRASAVVGAESLLPGQPPSAGWVDPATVGAQEQMRSVRELLLSPPVLESVRQEFKLDQGPGAHSNRPNDDLQSRIQIQMQGPTLFDLTFEGPDARQAMRVTNRLAELFVERTASLRSQRIEQHDNALDDEVDRARKQLNAQEEGLREFKERVSQELPDRLATNLKEMETLQQQIQTKNEQITDAEDRRSAINEELKELEKQGVLQQETPPKTANQVALEELRMKLAQLKTRYTPEHPEIRRTEQEIRDLEANTVPAQAPVHHPSEAQMHYVALQAEVKAIDPRVEHYHQERDRLISDETEIERRVNSTPSFENVLSERTKDAGMLRARYEALFAKQQEAQLSQRASTTSDSGFSYRVIEPATVPPAPYSPHRTRIVLFGLFAALGIGVMGIVAAERLDTRFESAEALESLTTLPVLASIPVIPQKLAVRRANASTPLSISATMQGTLSPERAIALQSQRLVALSDPQSAAAQQYGILALKIWRWMETNGAKTLLVTSAAGEEGKSLTALNLSLALASTSRGRVLLVDSDLRLPQVAKRLDLAGGKGFSDLLQGTTLDFAPFVSRVGELDVIQGGSEVANPAGLLASRRTRDVLERLREEYDAVVLDAPPLIPIADSHVLAGLTDGVMLVVRARHTRPEVFRRAVDSLGSTDIAGLVMNDVQYSATPYASAYEYHQRRYVRRA